jgi:hypothetical protein
MVFGLKKFVCMKRMCKIITRLVLTDAFNLFRSNALDQYRMNRLVSILIEGRLNKVMIRAARDEEWKYISKSGYSAGCIDMINSGDDSSLRKSQDVDTSKWPSLLNEAGSKIHMTSLLYEKKKVFEVWAFAFRLRVMQKIEMCAQVAQICL